MNDATVNPDPLLAAFVDAERCGQGTEADDGEGEAHQDRDNSFRGPTSRHRRLLRAPSADPARPARKGPEVHAFRFVFPGDHNAQTCNYPGNAASAAYLMARGLIGRAHCLGDLQDRRGEEELPDAVGGAVVGERFEVEDLAEAHAHVADQHHVHGHHHARYLAGIDLDGEVVGTHRGHVALAQPGATREVEARFGRAPRDAVVVLDQVPTPAGAEQQHVAGPDVDATLAFDRLVEVVGCDGHATFEPRHALEARDVEENAAPGDAVALLVDRVVQRAAWRDVARGIPVVELVVVEDVRERVPLRRALERHHDVVVGVAEPAGHVVLRLARRGHEVQRVLADPAAGLRAELVERDAEVEHLARAHETRRRDQPLRRDQVGGAALVVGSPPSPVAQPLTDSPEVVHPRTLSRIPNLRQFASLYVVY